MTGRDSALMNRRHALAERGDDLYQTPPEAVRALLAHVDLPHALWEPACGPGAIATVLRAAGHDVLATDLVDYGWDGQDAGGVDFLLPDLAESVVDDIRHVRPKAIVTNPPFKIADRFVARALDLAPTVCMLLRLAFIESERRRPILDNAGLARVLVFSRRLPMMHREGWEGRRASSNIAFAWFVWQRGHSGTASLERIDWS